MACSSRASLGAIDHDPPAASECSSGSSWSKSRSPAAAPGPDSGGPVRARDCRPLRPAGRRPRPGRVAVRRWWGSRSAAAAGFGRRGRRGSCNRGSRRPAAWPLPATGPSAHRPKAPAPFRVALVRKRFRACQCQSFQSRSETWGKKVLRKARVWKVLRGVRPGGAPGEKISGAGKRFGRESRATAREDRNWIVVLGGSSSSTREYEHASASMLAIENHPPGNHEELGTRHPDRSLDLLPQASVLRYPPAAATSV